MVYKSENLEKLRKLSEEMTQKESKEQIEREEIIICLEKLYSDLGKSKIDKENLKSEVKRLLDFVKK
jgi:hypothetical protein